MIKINKTLTRETAGEKTVVYVHYEYSELEGDFNNEVEMFRTLDHKYYECEVRYITRMYGSRYQTYFYEVSEEYMRLHNLSYRYRLVAKKLHGINGADSYDHAIRA